MFDLPPNISAALTGFIAAILLSIPVGPINLTIMNEGARRGFNWAAMIAAGAVIAELIYCTLAFTGFASFFEKGYIKAAMELLSFVFMIFLGVKFVLAKSIDTSPKLEQKIEEHLHPKNAFMIGFVRVIGNPGVLLFWIILAANFISREWVQPDWPGKLSCVAGVTAGSAVWFVGLSYLVSRGHRRLSEKTLLRMEHGSGIGLLVLAAAHGSHIVWQMAHHRI